MQTFFFDMKDGVPMRDRVGIDFKNDLEAIEHCKELAQQFRDGSLLDDQDLKISVVNSDGREIIASSFIAFEGRSVGVGLGPSQEISMHKDGKQVVETPVEARGGLLGRPVLLVLVVSCVLAVAALIITYSGA